MADNTHYYGIRPVRSRLGNMHNADYELRHVATAYQAQDDSANSVDLNIGDPVQLVSDGSVALWNSGDADLLYGVIVGFNDYWDGNVMQPTNRLPGGIAWGTNFTRAPYARVVPVDACDWEIDCDSTGQPTTRAGWEALLGQNVDMVCPGDLSDTSKPKADPYIDISTAATTATDLCWRIIGISPDASNKDLSGANVKLIVRANDVNVAGAAATPEAGV